MTAVELQLEHPFYVTGGTLSRDALCYVTRNADHLLYDHLSKGHFCYVLTARQMGKSSLMVRIASRLRDEGAGVTVLDLTAIGHNLTAEQWYGGLLTQMAQQLALDDELDAFWDSRTNLGPLQRWMQALRLVVLPHYPGRVVIFIDEIDAVRSLPFSTDEFFAGLREFYNRRTEDPELERLNFCLLGVAAPSDLIRDTRMTPFNIGQRIELHDFTEAESQVLGLGLGGDEDEAALMRRILFWTAGHPYLTQRLCQAVSEARPESATGNSQLVDCLCEDLFFTRRAREQDDNLLFVRERMLRSELELAGLLHLYTQVHSRKRVEDDVTNPFVTILKLSGITRIERGRLLVRNRIYHQVFDQEWVTANMPDAELRRQRAAYRKGLLRAAAIAAVILMVIAGLAFVAVRQRNLARAAVETNRQQLYAAHMNLAMQACDSSSIERTRELLAVHVPNPGQEDLRGFEWYYLWALSHQDLSTLHSRDRIASLSFTPDGKFLAVAGLEASGVIELWDVASGRESGAIKGDGPLAATVAFSPDGKTLATTSDDNTIRLCDMSTNREILKLKGHTNLVYSVAFSPDGKTLASAGDDKTGKLWNLATGELLATLTGHTDGVRSIAFSPDGGRVVTGSPDETVRIWDTGAGKEVMTLKDNPAKGGKVKPMIFRAAFTPDGRRILGIGNFLDVAVWDASTGKALPALKGHQSWITSIASSPDGQMVATGSHDRTVILWDAKTWRIITTIRGHGDQIDAVAFSPDSKTLATGGGDRTVKLWNVAARQNPFIRVQTGAVRSAQYSPDGKKVACSEEKTVRLWDAATWQELATFEGHTERVTWLAFSPDGRTLATASEDSTIRLWDTASAKERFVLKGHSGSVEYLVFTPDGEMLASGSQEIGPGVGSVKLWEVSTGQEQAQLDGNDYMPYALAFSPDGKTLATGSLDGTVKLWDVATRQQLAAFKAHRGMVYRVAFSVDGTMLATAGDDGSIKLWVPATGKQLATLKGHAGIVFSVTFLPDGRRLVSSGQDFTIRIWDLKNGQELITLKDHSAPVTSVRFSPAGNTLMSGGNDGLLVLRRAATKEEVFARNDQ